MTVERYEFIEATKLMRHDAERILWAHAVDRCPQVCVDVVGALASALGDISLGEAIDVVDRFQREAVAGSGR